MPDNEIKPVGKLRPVSVPPVEGEIKPVGKLTPIQSNEESTDEAYYQAISSQTPQGKLTPVNSQAPNVDYQKIESVLENLPGLNDGRFDVEARKEVLRRLAQNNAPYEVIRKSMDVLTGKDPKQQGASNYKYYVDPNGVPVALAPGERPPAGSHVASIWGHQKDAEDDNFFTSAAKHVANGLVRGAEGFADLGNLVYTSVTGNESETMNKLKNAADLLKFETKSAEKQDIYSGKLTSISDLTNPANYDFNYDNVTGNILNGMESVIGFALGTKGFGTAVKGVKAAKGAETALELTKLQAKATAVAGAYNMAVGEMMDLAGEAGLTGRNKAAFASVASVPQALLESAFGAEGMISNLITKNPAAKAEFKQLVGAAIAGLEKDAAGNITKEGLEQLNREMTVITGSFMKRYLKETGKGVAEETITEPLQEFAKRGAEKVYNALVEDKFKDAELFSPDAFKSYLNNAIGGFLGSIGPTAALGGPQTAQDITRERDIKQSQTIFGAIKGGPTAVNALKTNITKAFNDGEITREQYDNAITRVNAYKDYNDVVTSNEINLPDGKLQEVFDKTFQKQNLESQMRTMGKPEEMNPIVLAEYKAKEKMADDLQKDLNDIITSSRVNEQTIAGNKTVKDVIKKEEEEKKPEVKSKDTENKPPINPALQALMDRFGTKPAEIKSAEGLKYEDVSIEKYNDQKFNARDKHNITAEYVSRQPNKVVFGEIAERSFARPKKSDPNQLNTVYGFKLPDGKVIRFASSMEREEGGFRGHAREERLRDTEAVGTPVGMKYVWLEGDKETAAKPALKIFRADNGKFLGWAKATNTGKKQQFSEKQIEALNDEELVDETPMPREEESGTEPTPVSPTPTPSPVVTPEAAKPIEEKPSAIQKIVSKVKNIIAPNEQGKASDTNITEGESVSRNAQNTNPNASKAGQETEASANRENTEREKLKYVINRINRLNEIPLRERRTIQYSNALADVTKDAKELGYSISRTKGGQIQLFKGDKKVALKPKASPRMKEDIEEEKFQKQKEKSARNADPISINHAIALFIVNGGKFDRRTVQKETGEKELSTFVFTNKGLSIDDFISDLKESGLYTEDYIDNNQLEIADEVKSELLTFAGKDAYSIAKDIVMENYERMNNNGMTDAEVTEMANAIGQAEKLNQESEALEEANKAGVEQEFIEGYEALSELSDEALEALAQDEKAFSEWYDAFRGGKESYVDYYVNKLKQEGDYDENIPEFYETYFGRRYKDVDNGKEILQKKSSVTQGAVNTAKVIEVIKKNFKGYNVEYVPNLKSAGKLSGNTIMVNPYYSGIDTPIHEAGHILIDLMGDNAVINAAINQLKGTDLWNETAEAYPELSPQDLANEVLAEAIGREGAGIFKTEVERSAFMSHLQYIFDWLKRKLGLEKNIAKSLARQIISGKGLPSELKNEKPIEVSKPVEVNKEVSDKFAKSVEFVDKIKEAEGASKKRKLNEERSKFLEENPSVRYIENNMRNIVRQLQNKGIITTTGDCF